MISIYLFCNDTYQNKALKGLWFFDFVKIEKYRFKRALSYKLLESLQTLKNLQME